jgi:hypothetical protein
MDKDTLLRQMLETHGPLEVAVAALDHEAMRGPAPGMAGWTRKDVLAHVEWWNQHSVDVIEGARSGVDPYPGGDEPWDVDAFNARILAENRDRSPADVRRGEAASFRRLVDAVEATPEAQLFAEDPHPWLDGTVAETIADDSTRHYPEHVPHLG